MKKFVFLAGLAAVLPRPAAADYHIISPYEIDLGEIELETNGATAVDNRADHIHDSSYTAELGTGLTPWWHSEIELGFDRPPGAGQPTLTDQLVSENSFELTQPGEYFADYGFYFEYGQSTTGHAHAASNQATFGPLIAKDIGHTTETVNLLVTREFGPDQDTQGLDLTYAAQARWNYKQTISPAFEVYGDAGIIGASPRVSQQQLLLGPVAVGQIRLYQLGLGQAGQFKYELGYLFGATPATDRGTLRWRFELEIPF
jgi:hypothetical protein